MDNSIKVIFEAQPINVVIIDEEPWFVGQQVAPILGYTDTQSVLNVYIDDDDKRVINREKIQQWGIEGVSAYRYITLISVFGLYSLIYHSKDVSVKRFKHWIVQEVLPFARKTGKYRVKPPTTTVWDKLTDESGYISWSNAFNFLNSLNPSITEEDVLERLAYKEGWMFPTGKGSYTPCEVAVKIGLMAIKLVPDQHSTYHSCNFFTIKGVQTLLEMFSLNKIGEEYCYG